MTSQKYPPVGFHFKVSFQGEGLDGKEADAYFQNVSGLSVSVNTETVKEGGENRFEHVLPGRTSYESLTLKKGLFKDSNLIEWHQKAFHDMEYKPVDVVVSLLNEKHEPLMTWNVKHAWPKKWDVSDFNAEESAIVIETLEMNYNYFTLDTSGGEEDED